MFPVKAPEIIPVSSSSTNPAGSAFEAPMIELSAAIICSLYFIGNGLLSASTANSDIETGSKRTIVPNDADVIQTGIAVDANQQGKGSIGMCDSIIGSYSKSNCIC